MFNCLRRKAQPQHPYEHFLFDFEKLGERPSPENVTNTYPEGGLRLRAFEHLQREYPDDVRYLWHYLNTHDKIGVVDDEQYTYCFWLIRRGLSLEDNAGTHSRLRRLAEQLERQRHQILDDLGEDAIQGGPPDELRRLLSSGQHDKLIELFESVRNTHDPQGILGGDEDRRFWALYGMAIFAYFEKHDHEKALSVMAEYEAKRIKVKLTPIPDHNVQERVIGCLAQMRLSLAEEKLRYWVAHSKAPCISDSIKHHAAFRDLFTQG